MRAPTGTLLRIGLLLSMGLVVLTGCSDDPEPPSTLPDDSASATSSSVSPSPNTPEEQVEAAVRSFYAELTSAVRSQDTTRLQLLMTRGCPCYGYVRSIDKTKKLRQSARDAAWDLELVRVHDVEGATAVAEVRYVVSPYEILNDSGEVIKSYPKQDGHVDLSFVNGERGWIIGNVFNLEAPA